MRRSPSTGYVLLVLAGCAISAPGFKLMPVGTRVPVSELRRHDSDLRAFIVDEVEHHRDADAYFALDLLKTRPFAMLQLGAARGAENLRDLPSLVGELRSDDKRRGIVIVNQPDPLPGRDLAHHAYWDHVELFERRLGALAKDTPGLPYSFAARRVYGVASIEESLLVFSADEVFLSFVVYGERVFGFAIAGHRLVVRALPCPAHRIREILDHLLQQIREPSDPASVEWTADAADLYDAVLGPFAPELRDPHVRALFVSPDQFLANLPFALLLPPDGRDRTRPRPLSERLRVTYLPSVSVYRQLLERPILNEPPRVLAIANAHYPPKVKALPFAEREAVTVAELFPDSTLLTGAAATEARIVALAPRYNILHFATHGLLLEHIAPGASSLLVAADAKHDGFLNAAEIASLDLSHTYIAVLSACDTAATAEQLDVADPGSLINAFLGAGAPSAIGSLWQVGDQVTTLLMLGFYRRFLEVGAAEALRQAMLDVRVDPRFAHPFFWAAFVLYGWDK
jgi:CHAT domain-containing protein